MATDTAPAAVPDPSGGSRSDTPAPGLLASMLAPVGPARPDYDLAPADAAGEGVDGPVEGESSASYHGKEMNQDGTETTSSTSTSSSQKGVIRAWLLAGAARWAKGGGTANKRLDMQKTKANARQVKETRQVKIDRSGGLFGNSGAAGAGGKSLNSKTASGGAGKGPANSPKNTKNTGAGGGSAGSGGASGGKGGGTPGRGPAGRDDPRAPKTPKAPKVNDPKTGGGSKTDTSSAGKSGGRGASGSTGANGKTTRAGKEDAPKDSRPWKKDDGRGSSSDATKPKGDKTAAGAPGADGKAGGSSVDLAKTTRTPKADTPKTAKDDKSPKSADTAKAKDDAAKDGKATETDGKAGGSAVDLTKTTGTTKASEDADAAKDGKTPKSAETGKPETDKPKVDTSKDDKAKTADGTASATGGKPLSTKGSREAGYRDGSRAAVATAHVKAYRDGVKDGWGDTTEAAEQEKDRLEAVHKERKKSREDTPVSATTSTVTAKPITVKDVTDSHVILGDEAARPSLSRGEVRTLKGFERRLRAKAITMTKVAEGTKTLKAHAEAQATKANTLLDQAKAVKDGQRVIACLVRLADAAKTQAMYAGEIHRRAVRAAEAAKVVLANAETRYGGIYKAVVDSDLTTLPELAYYKD